LEPSRRSTRPTRATSPRQAAIALASDHLVALPTETVYGLGGLASSPTAIADIFRVKGRPATHPVIVHISGPDDVRYWSDSPPETALAVVEAFWPGPITVVVPKSTSVLDAVTGGQSTVALRAPEHPLFRNVLAELAELGIKHPGIAAPSANRFGRVSPTTAAHVDDELGEYLGPGDLILDGGPSVVGIESTIVLCGPDTVSIARQGGITAAEIERIVPVVSPDGRPNDSGRLPRVPGSLASHYAPDARVHLADLTMLDELARVHARVGVDQSVGVLGLSRDVALAPVGWYRLSQADPIDDLKSYARGLYAALRRADDLRLADVVAILPPADSVGIGPAIRDRLQRAATQT